MKPFIFIIYLSSTLFECSVSYRYHDKDRGKGVVPYTRQSVLILIVIIIQRFIEAI